MARTRAFDEVAVLTGAMMAFRQHGFTGASVRDLERATGLSVGSLYNAFGDKAGLYRAAIEHYFRMVIDPRLCAAETLEDLEAAFLALSEPPLADGFGCLVINGAMEFGGDAASPAADLIVRGVDTIENALERVLNRELGAQAGDAALRLGLIYRGLLVAARSPRPIAPYMPVVRQEFQHLRRLRSPNP